MQGSIYQVKDKCISSCQKIVPGMLSTAGTSPKLSVKERARLGSISPIHFHHLSWEYVPRVGRMENKGTRLSEKGHVHSSHRGSRWAWAPGEACGLRAGREATHLTGTLPRALPTPHHLHWHLPKPSLIWKYSVTFFYVEKLVLLLLGKVWINRSSENKRGKHSMFAIYIWLQENPSPPFAD